MKRWTACIVILLFLFSGSKVKAEEPPDRWKSLSETSYSAFQLAKQGRIEDSLKVLNYFSRQFQDQGSNSSVSGRTVRTISSVHQNAVDALMNMNSGEEDKVRAVTQFHMVVDAAFTENEPLWSSAEPSIMAAFQNMKKDAAGEAAAFEQDWNEFLGFYELIYPSVSVDVPPDQIRKVDALITSGKNQWVESGSEKEKVEHLTAMESEFQQLFDRVKKDESDPSLIWVIISTGGIIISTLFYAGWRKFKGEKQGEREREQ
ncbi:sporulation protein YpjB [Metabacillus mangrovi]|nr:sporulation protein YpjB [Metabacillus mangrovi]